MKIPLKGNLAVADKVRHAINRLNSHPVLVDRCHFECFDNCREQGYVLLCYSRFIGDTLHIAFTENRNSDNIVVYCYTETAYPSNLPAEDHWNDKTYFKPDDVADAAFYIIKRAKAFLKGVKS